MENTEVKKTRSKKPISVPTENVARVKTNAIATSFSLMKTITLTLIVFAIIVSVGAFFMVTQMTENANERAFFVTKAGTIMGSSQFNDAESRGYEVENHIKMFANHMFQFDQGNYDKNIEKALHLIGDDGKVIYQGYTDTNMKATLIKNNATLRVVVDSISMQSNVEPYKYTMYARQSFETSMGMRQQYLYARLTLSDVSRSENNVHGLMIDSFDTFRNDLVPKSVIEQDLQNN